MDQIIEEFGEPYTSWEKKEDRTEHLIYAGPWAVAIIIDLKDGVATRVDEYILK